MQAELLKTKPELSDVLSLWFRQPAGFRYEAGDYTELSLGVDGVEDRRWLSIASAPFEPNLQFTVKMGEPLSKFKRALSSMHSGQSVYLSPPMGNFNAPNIPDRLLLVAAGVGITPFRSILLQESKQPTGHDIQLFYAAKPKQFLFESELAKARVAISKFQSDDHALTLDDIKQSIADFNERFIYLAGPQPLTEGFFNQLIDEGHPRWRLRLCYFPGYKSI